MEKIIYVSIGVVILLMSQLVLAKWEYPSKSRKGIYHCTRDVDNLKSSFVTSEKSVDGYNKQYIKVSKYNDPNHTILRHCFVVSAEEIVTAKDSVYIIDGFIRNNSPDKVAFRIIDSIGYGVDRDGEKFGTVAPDNLLLDLEKRNDVTISCTKIMMEGDAKEDGTGYVQGSDLAIAFDKLSEDMRKDAREAPYNLASHNCCSVVYSNISKNLSLFRKEDISAINVRDYNVFGSGIWFEWTYGDFCKILNSADRMSIDIINGLILSASKLSSDIVNKLNLSSPNLSSYILAKVVSLGEEKQKQDSNICQSPLDGGTCVLPQRH